MEGFITIAIPIKKRYVKVFLENMCGSPCDLRTLPYYHELFLKLLTRTRIKQTKPEILDFHNKITIGITKNTFKRNGSYINIPGVRLFNLAVEDGLKTVMRQYINISSSLGISITDCIKEFQNDFDLHETDWSFDSIKKDIQRHPRICEIKTISLLKREIKTIFLKSYLESEIISLNFYNKALNEELL